MGLDSFETGGPRTYSSDNTKQQKVNGKIATDFEDEWGKSLIDASSDLEFIKDRLEEGMRVGELCGMFHWNEHTVVDRFVKMVDEEVIELEDLPNLDHPSYNEKDITYYIEERSKARTLDTMSQSAQSNNDEDDSSSTGLSSFRT